MLRKLKGYEVHNVLLKTDKMKHIKKKWIKSDKPLPLITCLIINSAFEKY